MQDTENNDTAIAQETAPSEPKTDNVSEWKDYGKFLIKLAIFMFILRSFIISPFNIPSESMQPRLLIGDYLLVSKWSYGYSNFSVAFGLPIIPGRIFASQPDRGDVVVFKAPPYEKQDYIKRVIGLPGDIIQMIDGILYINGEAVKKEKLSDFVIPVTQNMTDVALFDSEASGHRVSPCFRAKFEEAAENGGMQCRYPHYRETLPEGKTYEILDLVEHDGDNTEAFLVKEDDIFLMGDNRDRSADSRWPAEGNGPIGPVPQKNLVGRAMVTVFATDGSARWLLPWTWFTAARWDRIGETF